MLYQVRAYYKEHDGVDNRPFHVVKNYENLSDAKEFVESQKDSSKFSYEIVEKTEKEILLMNKEELLSGLLDIDEKLIELIVIEKLELMDIIKPIL